MSEPLARDAARATDSPTGESAPARLLSPVLQPLLFQRLRWRLWWNGFRVLVQRTPVRFATIFLCSLLVWVSLFALSYAGFRELRLREVPLEDRLMGLVLEVAFVALTILLVFSTGLILYSSLFSSAETSFLLSAPVRADQVFAYKYQSAVAFSSWAFVLLGSPLLLAYGIWVGQGAPWYFYAILPLYFLGFVLVPGSIGALLCFAIVNWVPRNRRQLVVLALAVLGMLLAGRIYIWFREHQDLLGSRDWFDQFFGVLGMVQRPLLPTHWMARGVQAAARDEPGAMFYNLCLVWSNGLVLYVLTAWVAGKVYRRGFNHVMTGGTLRRRYGGGWLDAALGRLLFFLDPQTRLLILKDFRTFRRDPAQWAQILIFLGLAVLYFSMVVRRFYEQDIGKPFQNGISLLNLTATAFLMCAYTGRFIFPMLSLEGRKFWILGLLPLQRDRLLWGKFAFATTGLILVATFLAVFSNLMLGMPWPIIAIHALTVMVLSMALSGLSVGLGACMPNFRESDPSKIAVGFGGTLNLVAGLLLLVVVIALMAAPWHLVHALEPDVADAGLLTWLPVLGTLAGAGVGLATGILPLRAGARALRRMEF